ncbi:MAG TPA: cyanophycinase [Bacillota bacterium]|nr:cyanophycinase [Bacillota bacterium]
MPFGDITDAFADLAQLLTQSIVMPLRRRLPDRRGQSSEPGSWGQRVRGTLVAAGGTVDDDLIVDMIHRGGGRRARALVLPAAHVDFQRAGERYIRYFTRFGMQRAEALPLAAREQANDREVAERIAAADIVFLAGGDAGLLLDVVAGTASEAALRECLRRGAVVAAAGAAAGVVGSVAVDWGGAAGVRPGLGLLPGCLIDRQGVQRGRLGRFLQAVASTPDAAWGIGLEEGSALVIEPGWQVVVHGQGPALCVDARMLRLPSPSGNGAVKPPLRDPIALLASAGAPVHVLSDGWRLDLRAAQILPPAPPPALPGKSRRRG